MLSLIEDQMVGLAAFAVAASAPVIRSRIGFGCTARALALPQLVLFSMIVAACIA
jgi:hypothetical protein